MITQFEDLLEDLATAEVEFILVGGLAVALNGHNRTTEDMDILVDNSPENIQRLLSVLASFGEGSGATYTAEDFSNEPGALRVYEDFMLDIFVQMNGKTLRDLKSLSAPFKLTSGREIFFLTYEGLRETKLGSTRPKDQHDLIVLSQLSPQNRPGDDFRIDSVREEPSEDSNPAP
jgi:hypothetical protein